MCLSVLALSSTTAFCHCTTELTVQCCIVADVIQMWNSVPVVKQSPKLRGQKSYCASLNRKNRHKRDTLLQQGDNNNSNDNDDDDDDPINAGSERFDDEYDFSYEYVTYSVLLRNLLSDIACRTVVGTIVGLVHGKAITLNPCFPKPVRKT